MIVTSTDSVEGRQITHYLGIVAGEAIMGVNVFRDLFSSVRDIVGGRAGGYQAALKATADRLNREWSKSPARAHAILEYYRATQNEYVQRLKAKGYSEKEIGVHAGLADTSLMLAIDPHLVRSEQLHGELRLDKNQGVAGDPRRATAELGQIGVDVIVTKTVNAIKQAVAQDESVFERKQ